MQIIYETVKEIVDSGRVGIPVFMQCTVQVAPETEQLEDVLVRMLAMSCSWLGASPLRVYVRNDRNWTQISAAVEYAGGQTSIVRVNTAPGVTPRLDFMLLGNKGALCHDAEALHPEFDIAVEPTPIPGWLVDAVGQSLRTGKPVVIEEAADFE